VLCVSLQIRVLGSDREHLRELIDRLLAARDAAGRFVLSMKRARQRSTDAKRAIVAGATKPGLGARDSIRLEAPLQKRIDLAEGELRDLNLILTSFSKASRMIELEETANMYSIKLGEANKRIRQLQSDNMKRANELERLAKTPPVDTLRLEESLRKDLMGLMQKNTSLTHSIETSRLALETCGDLESKLRQHLSPPLNLTSRRNELIEKIERLKREKEDLTNKWNRMRMHESLKISYLSNFTKKTSEEVIHMKNDSLSVIEPIATALQSPSHHALAHEEGVAANVVNSPVEREGDASITQPLDALAEPLYTNNIDVEATRESGQCDAAQTAPAEYSGANEITGPPPLTESKNMGEMLPVSQVVEQQATMESEPCDAFQTAPCPVDAETTEEKSSEFQVPDVNYSVTKDDDYSEEFHASDEKMTASELAEIESLHVAPRRLFQSSVAKEDDSHILGSRDDTPPLIQIPKVFHVTSRHGDDIVNSMI
jgi:hypothetical protein